MVYLDKRRISMGIPVKIDTLLHEQVVESTRIEFKEDFNPAPIIHTICAFANDIDNIGGGYIVIGVAEKDGVPQFPVKGIERERIDGICKKLLNYTNLIEPRYVPIAEPVVYEGKNLILIWVKGGRGRPYRAPKDVIKNKTEKMYYIRKLSSTIQANERDLRDLYFVSETIPFDDCPNFTAEVSDLSHELLEEHLKKIGSSLALQANQKTTLELARDMQLISGPPEDERPVNAAILLFCENPQRFFRYAYIEVVEKPDPTGEGMVEKIFSGPIQYQLKNALIYIQNNVLKEKISKVANVPEAQRSWNYPFAAVEEILSNAVYHKSYQLHEPITVVITPDYMEITSHPGFDSSIKEQDIQKYEIRSRIYRNRRIGDFLKELKLIEGRNTGFPTAIQALERNGSGKLQFEYDEERNYLSVILPVHPSFKQKTKLNPKEEAYQKKIMAILEAQPLTLTQLSAAMGYKGITSKLRQSVNLLLEQGTIVYVRSKKREKLLGLDKTR
jgi:ATP-dependent DNA helicase RecG